MSTGETVINKFEGMTDDEVLDIATTPGIKESLATSAEQELERRANMAKATVDIATKLSQPETTETSVEEQAEAPEVTIEEPAEDTTQTLGAKSISVADKLQPRDYSEYDDHELPSREKIPTPTTWRHYKSHAMREWDREKDERKAPIFDKHYAKDKETDAFYRQVASEGRPEIVESTYSDEEILRDAEKQIRSHLDDFLTAGFMAEYRSGNSTPRTATILEKQYGSFIDRRAYTYSREDDEINRIKHQINLNIIPEFVRNLQDNPERISDAETIALENLIEQGIKTEEDEFGNLSYQYSIPDKFIAGGPDGRQSRVARFDEKYGTNSSQTPEIFMQSKGIDFEDPQIQNKSFHGFFKIADIVKNTETPDTSKLDWYFDSFRYTEPATMARMIDSMNSSRNVSQETRQFLINYLEQKPAYQEYIEKLNSAEVIESEERELSKTVEKTEFASPEESLKQIYEAFGLDPQEMDRLITFTDFGADILSEHGKFGETLNNHYIQTSPDVNVKYDPSNPDLKRVFDPEEFAAEEAKKAERAERPKPTNTTFERKGRKIKGEDYAFHKALTIAVLFKAIQRIDPTAQIGIAAEDDNERPEIDKKNDPLFDDQQYLLIRFGCPSTHPDENGNMVTENYNHVIAENITPVGATYYWYGHGEGWRTDLKGKPEDIRKRQNVDRSYHAPTESLTYHLTKTIFKLGIQPNQIFNPEPAPAA